MNKCLICILFYIPNMELKFSYDYDIFELLNEIFFFVSRIQDYLHWISSTFSVEIHILPTLLEVLVITDVKNGKLQVSM